MFKARIDSPIMAPDAETLARRMVSGRTGSGESTMTSRRSGKVLSQLTTVKKPDHLHHAGNEELFFAPDERQMNRWRQFLDLSSIEECAERLKHADHDEHAGKLAEEPWYVSFNRQGFKIDDAQKKLAIEDAKGKRKAGDQLMHRLTHG
jgi:hypothetical protein